MQWRLFNFCEVTTSFISLLAHFWNAFNIILQKKLKLKNFT